MTQWCSNVPTPSDPCELPGHRVSFRVRAMKSPDQIATRKASHDSHCAPAAHPCTWRRPGRRPVCRGPVGHCVAPGCEPRAGRPRDHVALWAGSQRLRRHRPQHIVEGVVHRGRWRALRRVLPDDRQHEHRDPAVHRHRRLDLHRPADPRHHLHREVARRQRDVVPDHEHRQERQVHARHRLPHGPTPQQRGDGDNAQAGTRRQEPQGLRADGRDRQRQRRRR